jgi:hypothetical protein
MDLKEARKILRDAGYYVDNLWTVEDVTQNYKCTREQAQEVLDRAMSNEATMNQIWLSIDYACEDLEIRQLQDI